MTEKRVVVEVDLGVEREQASVRSRDERIDLHQRSVSVKKSLVEIA